MEHFLNKEHESLIETTHRQGDRKLLNGFLKTSDDWQSCDVLAWFCSGVPVRMTSSCRIACQGFDFGSLYNQH